MPSRESSVFFLVSTEEQLQTARAVAGHLRESFVIDPYAGWAERLTENTHVTRRVKVRATPTVIARARRVVGRAFERVEAASPVLVIAQDVGYVERAAIAAASARHARLILMPDGIVASKSQRCRRRAPLTLSRDAIDRGLQSMKLVAGTRHEFGSSRPQLVLSWGSGWESTWRSRCPDADVLHTGSPRADGYAAVAARTGVVNVLVCSQPLLLPLHSKVASQADEWYRWLKAVRHVRNANLRIRLHPSERAERYPLPAELRTLRSAPASPLVDDLSWADIVAAPFSSVLVEALAVGRIPVSAGGTSVWGSFAANAFLADPRVPTIDFRSHPDPSHLVAEAQSAASVTADLRGEFLANLGLAAERCADAIRAYADM